MANSALDALKYAEENLGVHEVYEGCTQARNHLDETLTSLSEARDKQRDIEYKLVDREMLVASDERGKHPDMSATGMEKHLKIALQNDDDTRELREKLSGVKGDIEGLEFDRHVLDTDIKIGIARMTELGGYLNFLSVIKASESIKEVSSV